MPSTLPSMTFLSNRRDSTVARHHAAATPLTMPSTTPPSKLASSAATATNGLMKSASYSESM
jgi:hypothetical protein